MFKFELGQKVRHIDKQIFGEVAGMECYNDDKVYAIRTDQGIEHFIESDLEEFRFKEGDVVRVIASDKELDDFDVPLKIPRILTIKNVHASDEILSEDGWYYEPDMLTLIPQHQLDQSIQGAVVKSVPEPPKADPVNHPPHYTQGGIETIDFIKAKMTHEQFEGYLLGNIIKYLTRYNHKGNAVQDLEKAQTYLNWLTEHIKGE